MNSDTINVVLVLNGPTTGAIRAVLEDPDAHDLVIERVDTVATAAKRLTSASADLLLIHVSAATLDRSGVVTPVDEFPSTLPVVLVSNHDVSALTAQAVLGGAQDYLVASELAAPAFVRALRHVVTRNRRNEALRRSEADYRALVENATYGIYRSNAAGDFLAVNPALVSMLGYASRDELLAVSMANDLYVDPVEREQLLAQFGEAQRFDGVQVQWRRKDGTRIIARLSGRAVRETTGSVQRFEVIVEDVTTQHELEAQLRQAQKMEAVGRLTSGIAHDFNNLLTVIVANTELMLASLPLGDGDLRTKTEAVQHSALSGASMIRKLLGFSRQAELSFETVELGSVVEVGAEMLRRLLPEDIHMKVRVESADVRVCADAAAVQQILMNLVTNARDAMSNGGHLRLTLRRARRDAAFCARHPWCRIGEYARITVGDTGRGMDTHTLQRIFEPFFTTKPATEGTGLGMPMVYGLMKQHDGFIHVLSRPGSGTTVELDFPLADNGREPAQRDAPPAAAPPEGGDETILLVEDDDSLRRVARQALEQLGYTVLAARDGQEALETFDAHRSRIDLVLTDLIMPRMGGRELAKAIRNAGSDVALVYVSGYGARDVRKRCGMADDTPLLPKPWTLDELARAVRRVLDGRRTE